MNMADGMEHNPNMSASEDKEVSGCCGNAMEPKEEKDFRKEADEELERIKREADRANRDIEEVVEKGNEQGD
jgi:hypothetical protein